MHLYLYRLYSQLQRGGSSSSQAGEEQGAGVPPVVLIYEGTETQFSPPPNRLELGCSYCFQLEVLLMPLNRQARLRPCTASD